jgi:ATP-binding cassette subfamily F protein uup
VNLRIQDGQRSGKLVADVRAVSFSYGDKPIVRDFSTTIMRGDKIGIIGPNGAGKTTLLQILLGHLEPQSGTVRMGAHLHIAYFDQLRKQLNDEQTVQFNVGDGYETIKIGDTSQHVIGYLRNFLFSPERAQTLVRFLSGGERNRVLLAKLFAKPANLIVLDEPTNDLDFETLELLEQRLVEFRGTVLLVSHDREFLNNVVTSTIVFQGGNVKEYVGGYDDWLRQAAEAKTESATPSTGKSMPAHQSTGKRAASTAPTKSRRRLTFKEQKELDTLPEMIERLEQQIGELHELFAKPEFYRQAGPQIATERARLQALEEELANAYARWEQLD